MVVAITKNTPIGKTIGDVKVVGVTPQKNSVAPTPSPNVSTMTGVGYANPEGKITPISPDKLTGADNKNLGKGIIQTPMGEILKTTDVGAGQQTYNITGGQQLSKYIATGGREGLPFALQTGSIEYKGKTYTAVETGGKDYIVQSRGELNPVQRELFIQGTKNASPVFLEKLGVVEIAKGGSPNPFLNQPKGLSYEIINRPQESSKQVLPFGATPIASSITGGTIYSIPSSKEFTPYNNQSNNKLSGLKLIEEGIKGVPSALGEFGSQVAKGGTELLSNSYSVFGLKQLEFSSGKIAEGKFGEVFTRTENNLIPFNEEQKAFMSVVGLSLLPENKFVTWGFRTLGGLQIGKGISEGNPKEISSGATMFIPDVLSGGTKIVKAGYESVTGRTTPNFLSNPRSFTVESNPETSKILEFQTSSRRPEQLQLSQRGFSESNKPLYSISYFQKMKSNELFSKTKSVPVVTEVYPGGQVKTAFILDKVSYLLEKTPEMEKTLVSKTYASPYNPLISTKVGENNFVSFTKSFSERSGGNLEILNIKETVPAKLVAELPNKEGVVNSILQASSKEQFFDVSLELGGKKIKGYGKQRVVDISKSTAGFSNIVTTKTFLEQPTFKDVKFTESGESVYTFKEEPSKILGMKAIGVEVKPTELRIGKADYWKDISSKNVIKSIDLKQVKEAGFEPINSFKITREGTLIKIGEKQFKATENIITKNIGAKEGDLVTNAFYNPKTGEIKYDYGLLINKDFKKMVLLHEVGHKLDFEEYPIGVRDKTYKALNFLGKEREQKYFSVGYTKNQILPELSADLYSKYIQGEKPTGKYEEILFQEIKQSGLKPGYEFNDFLELTNPKRTFKSITTRTIKKGQVTTQAEVSTGFRIKVGGKQPKMIKDIQEPISIKAEKYIAKNFNNNKIIKSDMILQESLKSQGINLEFKNLKQKQTFLKKIESEKKQGLTNAEADIQRANLRNQQSMLKEQTKDKTRTIKMNIPEIESTKVNLPSSIELKTIEKNINKPSKSLKFIPELNFKELPVESTKNINYNKVINPIKNEIGNKNINKISPNLNNKVYNEIKNNIKNEVKNNLKNEIRNELKIDLQLKQEQMTKQRNIFSFREKLKPEKIKSEEKYPIFKSLTYPSNNREKKSENKIKKWKGMYTPSLEAAYFNLKGTKPTSKLISQGLNTRVIIRRGR